MPSSSTSTPDVRSLGLTDTRYRLAADAVALLEAPLAEVGYELLDVRVFRGGGRLTLRIYVDTADGITIDGCADASRTVGMLLEEATLVGDAHVIEVTSPGVRRPLRTRDHFEAARGQDVILKLAGTGRRSLKGRLTAVGDAGLEIDPAEVDDTPETMTVAWADIREANLDPEFDVQALINADRRRRKEEKRLARERRRGRKKGGPRS